MQVWIKKNSAMIFFFFLFLKQFEFTACRKYDKIFRHMEKYHKLCKPHVMLNLCTPLDILVHLFISCVSMNVLLQLCEYEWVKIWCSVEKEGRKKSFQISCSKVGGASYLVEGLRYFCRRYFRRMMK